MNEELPHNTPEPRSECFHRNLHGRISYTRLHAPVTSRFLLITSILCLVVAILLCIYIVGY